MHVKPVRYQEQRCLHFVTFSCSRRVPLLNTVAAKNTFEAELERVRVCYGCYITGYVVMPEHVHLLLSEPERAKLSVAIQMLKEITSQTLRPKHLRRFWQVRYYDFPRGLEMEKFVHCATGTEGTVEIESQWTARKREQLGVVVRARAHPPAKNAGCPISRAPFAREVGLLIFPK